MQEYKELINHPPEGIVAGPVSEDNIFEWEALITGPPGTPYEGGAFTALLKFPKDYPLNPPKMIFQTPMWHPNSIIWFSILSNFSYCFLCSLKFTRMEKFASASFIHQERTLFTQKPPSILQQLKSGLLFKLLRRYSFLWFLCWQNQMMRAEPIWKQQ
eukprot:TRINITY_DN134_c0_g1_i3.p1 TRINITY_DN134_c0_g1~~TRINITY_DN134_c0_g1_i3.p1  ORF type:complete len:180 (-),score=27.68 TRINITY_DN134_c0_g1_i3:333-806(-)